MDSPGKPFLLKLAGRVRNFLQRTQVPEKFNSSFWRPKYPSSLLLVITLRYFPQFELFDKTYVMYCMAGPSAITDSTNRVQQQQPLGLGTAMTCITTPLSDSVKQPLQLVVSLLGVSEFLSPAAWLGTALRTRPRAVL